MADYPDLAADGFSITVGPFGVIITLTRVIPPDPSGAPGGPQVGAGAMPTEAVARVRLTAPIAQELASKITQLIQQQATQGQKATISH